MEAQEREFVGLVKGRRSILKYKEEEVSNELLYRVLESLRWSPSWDNTQCWEVIVVKEPAIRKMLQETLPKTSPSWNAVVQAPIVLGLCGELQSAGYQNDQAATKFGDWFMFDLGIATQSLCLTAHELELGTVIAGLFDHEKAKEILWVPDNYELVVLISLGYPAVLGESPKRRQVTDYMHSERF